MQSSRDLRNWTTAISGIVGTGAIKMVNFPSTGSQKYYRVILQE